MSSLDDLQRRVGEWGKQTFPHSTRGRIIAPLKRELKELEGVSENKR